MLVADVHSVLANNGSAYEAVEAAVVSMENCPLFNALEKVLFIVPMAVLGGPSL